MNTTTDFHQQGVFAVKDAQGNVLFDTFASTAYSARANFGRIYNKKWRAAEQQGYTMHGYAESVKVVSESREGEDVPVSDADKRIAELEAIEQPLDVIEAGNGGDFGKSEYEELHRLRAVRDSQSVEADLVIPRTADEWDLYSDRGGAGYAAEVLANKLEGLLLSARATNNCTLDEAVRIRDLMYAEMDRFVGIGARDTVPETVLVSSIAASLGLKNDSLSR